MEIAPVKEEIHMVEDYLSFWDYVFEMSVGGNNYWISTEVYTSTVLRCDKQN